MFSNKLDYIEELTNSEKLNRKQDWKNYKSLIMKLVNLIPGKTYIIKKTGELCHTAKPQHTTTTQKDIAFNTNNGNIKAIFLGTFNVGSGKRNIFYGSNGNFRYYMFDTRKLNYIIDEDMFEEKRLKESIDIIEEKIKNIKELLKGWKKLKI